MSGVRASMLTGEKERGEQAGREQRATDKVLPGVLTGLLGASLLQGGLVAGVNFSTSDIVLIVLLILAIGRGVFTIPVIPLEFFLLVLVVTSATGLFLSQVVWGVSSNDLLVIVEGVKLAVAFLYFLMGLVLAETGQIASTLKWYAGVSLVLALIGTLWTVAEIPLLRQSLFFGGFRYRALVDDPNLAAVLMIAALPYLVNVASMRWQARILAVSVIVGGVLATGSKTGLAVLVVYLSVLMVRYVWSSAKDRSAFVRLPWVLAALLVVASASPVLFGGPFGSRFNEMPSVSRAFSGLTSTSEALNDGGSFRMEGFSTALEMIERAPLTGVGSGSYAVVAEKISGSAVIAHNTYLQLFSQWGILLAMAFFVSAFMLILPSFLRGGSGRPLVRVALADTCVVILLGGVALSLNNVRVFWLCLGGLYAFWSKTRGQVDA